MKTVLFIRHAKSSWSSETLRDFDRPLNERGQSDAPQIGKEVLGKIPNIQHIFCSSSVRTKQTAELLFKGELSISFHNELYHPSSADVIKHIHTANNKHNGIAIISHNPTTTDVCNSLQSDVQFANIPTCGVVSINFDVENWQNIKFGKLNFYIFPNKDKNYLII